MSNARPESRHVEAPPEHDETDLDMIADHALATLATRYATASSAVQELFENYTRQAQALLTTAQNTAEAPKATDNEPSSTSS